MRHYAGHFFGLGVPCYTRDTQDATVDTTLDILADMRKDKAY
jgi:hypothetical protein